MTQYGNDARTASGFDPDRLTGSDEPPTLTDLLATGLIPTGMALQVSIVIWNGLTFALYLGRGDHMISLLWAVVGVVLFIAGVTLAPRRRPESQTIGRD